MPDFDDALRPTLDNAVTKVRCNKCGGFFFLKDVIDDTKDALSGTGKIWCLSCWSIVHGAAVISTDDIEIHSTGAKREPPKLDYYSIYDGFLSRLAAICQEGLENYGRDNWKKGLPIENTYDHALAHLMEWKNCRDNKIPENQDNLAKVAWGMMCLIFEDDIAQGKAKRP